MHFCVILTESLQMSIFLRELREGGRPVTKHQLVKIEWQDSTQPVPAWQHLNDLAENKPIHCVSVGFLLQDDVEMKVLAPNMADILSELNIQASGIITIPSSCVVKITKLYF